MSIGQDIAEVLDELGMTVEVRRPDTDEYEWFQERIELTTSETSSNPFDREFLANASFRHNTQIECGDIVRTTVSSIPYVVLTKTPQGFEDQVIEFNSLLYRCNVSGIVLKQIDAGSWASDYTNQAKWVPVYAGAVPIVLASSQQVDAGAVRGVLKQPFGEFENAPNDVFISGWYHVPGLSRFRYFSVKYFPWIEWEESVSYNKKDLVLSSDYRLFKSIIKDNIGNDPIYTSQDNYEDEYYIKCWEEIPYTDVKLERTDTTRFENVIVYSASSDLR